MSTLTKIAWLVLVPAVFFLSGCNYDHAMLGRQRFEAGDYSGAAEELKWALKKNPHDGDSRYLLGRAQAKSRNTYDAKVTFRALRSDPAWRKPATRNLVQLLQGQKNFDEADKLIAEELVESPDDSDWLEARGIVALGRLDAEKAAYQKRLQDTVGEGPASWALGRIVEVCTLPDQTALAEAVNIPVNDLLTRWGLADPAEINEFAARARAVTLPAQADLTAAVAKNPLAFRALKELGKLAAGRDDVEAARKHLGAFLAIDESALPDAESRAAYASQYGEAVAILAAELENAKLIAEAVVVLAAARKKGVLGPKLEEQLGRLYFETGQLAEAGEIASGIITRDPKNSWGNYLRGELEAKAGKDETAIVYFNRALVLDRMNARINAALARAYVRVGRLAQADEHFGIAIGQGLGSDLELNLEYARLIAQTTDPAQAAQFLENRLKAGFNWPSSPDHQRILDEIRTFYESLGLKAGTLFEARNALAINPQNAFAKLAVAKIEAGLGHKTIALARTKEVTQEYPGIADAWLLQAQILADLGKGADAIKGLDEAAKFRPDDPNIPWIEGRVHLAEKKFDLARKALNRALEMDSRLAGPRLDLAEVELGAANFQAADAHARMLLQDYPDDPRVHRITGLAKLGLRDAQAAIAPLRRATSSRPADPWLRVKLGIALIESGARKEGAAELATLAADAATPRGVRGQAAQALLDAGFFSEAADAFNALLAAATNEGERVELSKGAFQARLSAGDPMNALDELNRMRLSGRTDAADRLFVVAAQRAGHPREAAAQADLLRARDGHDLDSLAAAAQAHAAVEQWNKCLEDLDDLARLKPEAAQIVALERARALLALGRLADAAKNAEIPTDPPDVDPSKALRLRLEIAAAGSEPEPIEVALRAALARSHGDPSALRMIAAKALVRLGKLETAAPILSASPFRAPDEESAVLAGAILVAAGDPTGAAALLDGNIDRGPRVAAALGLVAVILDKRPAADAPLALFLDRAARGDQAGAREAAARLSEPESIRELWASIARALPTKPEDAAAAVQDLARARLWVESRLLGDRAFTVVRGLGERAGKGGSAFDLLRAWWKLELDGAKAAADIVVPMLETDGRNPTVLLIASLAGLELAGPDSPSRLMDAPGGPVADSFLRDLARAAAARGIHATAARASAKIQQPTEDDRVLRLLLATERREVKDASAAAKALTPEALARPELAIAKLWVGAQHPQTKDAAAAGIKALAALPRDLERADLPLLYEAAQAAGLKAEADQILGVGLTNAGFSADGLQRFVEAIKRARGSPESLARLEERIDLLDPTGKLRALKPRGVTLATR